METVSTGVLHKNKEHYLRSKDNNLIKSQIRTCHDSWAAVLCAHLQLHWIIIMCKIVTWLDDYISSKSIMYMYFTSFGF